jgi:D-aminopeptidase
MKITTKKNLKRFRDYGFSVGFLPTGKRNTIADVANVKVGHKTICNNRDIFTGITVIDPGIKNLYRNKIQAAIAVGNGYGKLVGSTQVEELGTLETPIALTNTLAVGLVMRGIVDLVIANTKDIKPFESINAVVGETNDGFLSSLHKDVIAKKHVMEAYESCTKDFAQGSVGAGTGTRAFSWKGGIGSSSRVVTIEGKKYTVGAILQTNFGGSLNMLGVPVGEILGKSDFKFLPEQVGDGSCMIVIATDAPLSSLELKRLAKRAFIGLGKTGSIMAPQSGDYCIAFSACRGRNYISDIDLTPFFLAVVESVEESVYEALCCAKAIKGRDGNTLEKFPMEEVTSYLNKYDNNKHKNKK